MFRSPRALMTLALSASLAGCVLPSPLRPTTGGTTGSSIANPAGGLAFEGGTGEPAGSGKSASRPTAPMAPAMDAAPASAPAGGLISSNGGGLISNNAGGLVADGGSGMLGTGAEETAIAQPLQQEALKAGAIDDNAKFEDYMIYRKDYQGPAMRALDISERHLLQVVDDAGHAVDNAVVTVTSGGQVVYTGRSYANGELLFHPKATTGAEQATSFTVKAAKGELTKEQTFERSAEGVWKLALGGSATKTAAKVDVLFLLDATGSMGGEIARLQDTIGTVASRLQGLSAQPTVRFGLVAYRDQGEDYVTASADFTGRIEDFKASLAKVEAAGGGDKAEDVESGLAKAVNGASWSDDAVKLVFLVADAAPHVDYPQSTPYTTSMKKAAEKGIKLFPIGCSGLEPEGEYAYRQMAQFTMGQYLFITRGGDELSGGGEVSHTVDKFSEGRLDDIVVDLVKAELDGLGK